MISPPESATYRYKVRRAAEAPLEAPHRAGWSASAHARLTTFDQIAPDMGPSGPHHVWGKTNAAAAGSRGPRRRRGRRTLTLRPRLRSGLFLRFNVSVSANFTAPRIHYVTVLFDRAKRRFVLVDGRSRGYDSESQIYL
ncbi:hypothetical protein EVAR_79399_1 [Eumeta japonica]|uniref:Uncharacterized protein n=1 Tax=Eumeta variegata TaxID=151549 RepID=A0A4C1VF48_EUMVA|nr:hypothetical protein EVAR_79399_1 [Eumeta japonica]